MRAAVLRGPGDLGVEDRPRPTAGPGELVLKVTGATVCGTDVRILTGEKTSGVRIGAVMGHEFAGTIDDIGDGLTGYETGQLATVSIVVSCNRCAMCLRDMEHMCLEMDLFGYAIDGGLADFVKIPARAVAQGNVVLAKGDIPGTHLALAEPLSCCLNGFDQYRVNPGDVVVILGAGAIGLIHLQLAKLAGAREVVVSNRSAARRAVAEELGATRVVDPSEVAQAVREVSGGLGADVVVQCIGNLELAGEALTFARVGGRVNYFAGFPKGSTATIDPNLIHYNELHVTGGSNARRRDVIRAVRMLESGAIDASKIVTHTFGLEQLDDAFSAVQDRRGVKIAVVP